MANNNNTINYKKAPYVSWGTQVSDGVRIAPFVTLDNRGQQIESIAGVGLPVPSICVYKGYVSSSTLLENQFTLAQGEKRLINLTATNPWYVNTNLNTDPYRENYFAMDWARTVEVAFVDNTNANSFANGLRVTIKGYDICGQKLVEQFETVEIADITLSISGIIAGNGGYITIDGFTSSKKSFLIVTEVLLENIATDGSKDDFEIYVRTGNCLGLPYLTYSEVPIAMSANGRDYLGASLDEAGSIYKGLDIYVGESSIDSIDPRGMAYVQSRDSDSLGAIIPIKINGTDAAKIPFKVVYDTIGGDMMTNIYQQLDKTYWETLGDADEKGTIETLKPFTYEQSTASFYGVPQYDGEN